MKSEFDNDVLKRGKAGKRLGPARAGQSSSAGRGAVAAVLLAAALGGCQAAQPTGSASLAAAVDPVALTRDLHLQLDSQLSDVVGTASEIAAAVPDRRVRENCLRWKIRFYKTYRDIVTEAEVDPRQAFLSAWTAAVGMRLYLTSAEGGSLFGPQQPAAVALAKKMEEDVVALGKKHFPAKAIDDAADDVAERAPRYSPTDVFTPRPAPVSHLKSDIHSLLNLPLLPVRTLEGASSTPKAIDRFTDTVQDFAVVVRHLPEQTRWESELLLLEMESTGPVAALGKQLDRLEQIVRDSTDELKTIPPQLRQEFEKSLAAVEKAQPPVKDALSEARAAATEAGKAAAEVAKTAEQCGLAAKSFQSAAAEVRGVLTEYKQIAQANSQPAPQQAQARPEDYRALAESISAAAKETRALLSELQQPVSQQSSIRQAADEFGRVTNALFWKALALILIVFFLALIYGLTGRRNPAREQREPPKPKS